MEKAIEKTTKTKRRKSKAEISDRLIETVCGRLSKNERVRRTLPGKGRLHIDRQVPFLCVYRQPLEHEDAGTERLVKGEASYLIAPVGPEFQPSVSKLIYHVVRTLSAEFGAFLIVEIWTAPEGGRANDPAVPTVLPTFAIHGPRTVKLTKTLEAMARRLRRIKILKHGVEVELLRDDWGHPTEFPPLLSTDQCRELNCSIIGLAVPPVFRKPKSTAEFPLLIGSLRHSISLALRQSYFEFARARTTHRPPHYHALGRKAVVKAVWDIDRQLAAVSNQFDYLLQLTPVNPIRAWKQFQASGFDEIPEFHYRPLPVDPTLLKRDLYKIPIERVEDPALQRLFREKQEELELKLTMLRDRDTSRFLYESLTLFGGVKDGMLKLATDLLQQLPSEPEVDRKPKVDADKFAKLASKEIDFYRQNCPEFKARAVITDDVSGLIVSRGKLMINSDMSLPASRVEPLLAHEVGTHLLTYYNGRLQPFQQLYSGFAGYEELQEGLAVLSEYLVGGLNRARMRQLAARVVAVRHLVDGASFVETFRSLSNDFGFSDRVAYNITMRVFRGGGLTKDAIYLRGLVAILKYVKQGRSLDPLFAGKMAVEHIPIIKELQYRNVLAAIRITPRYMQQPESLARLDALRSEDVSLVDLVTH
jgi:uncharacterized protein (TIGR02421 family)